VVWNPIFSAYGASQLAVVLAGAGLASICISQLAVAQSVPLAGTAEADSADARHALDPALQFTEASLQHIQARVDDYTALLTKRVRVGGELGDYQFASVKIRNRRAEEGRIITPMSVYLKFLKPAAIKGREVIWVEGRNNGKLVAHDGGLKNLLRVNLDPTGPLAMRGQRYPITEIGIENLALKLIEKGERDRMHEECQLNVYKGATVAKRSCTMFEIIHPVEREHFDFHRAHVFFDDELNVPIRYASWSWPMQRGGQPVLEEEYTYTDIKLNVGLTEGDFDPDNPSYDFW
jgi:hypothetical protein